LIRLHWGYDLPIAGGWGESSDDPVVIDAAEVDVVAFTAMQVLQGIGRGRALYWRSLNRSLVSIERPRIEEFKIETVELTPTQKITQIESYYFDVSALAEEWQPIEAVLYIPRFDLRIPCEIGWLHAGAMADNEAGTPGAGVAVRYIAPAVNATMFIYDLQRTDVPEDVTDPLVRYEFERAVRDISDLAPEAEAQPDPPFNERYLSMYFKTGENAKNNILVALTTYKSKFLKMRVTWKGDEFIDEVAAGWVHSVANLVRP
jgi:hypothetical protein